MRELNEFIEWINEADNVSSAGMSSPLSTPGIDEPDEYRSKKDFRKKKDTSGKDSPLSRLQKIDEEELNELKVCYPYEKCTDLTYNQVRAILHFEGYDIPINELPRLFGEEPVRKEKIYKYIAQAEAHNGSQELE